MRGAKTGLASELPDSPLLVFINSRSGGRAGSRLAEVLYHAIGHSQVIHNRDQRGNLENNQIFSAVWHPRMYLSAYGGKLVPSVHPFRAARNSENVWKTGDTPLAEHCRWRPSICFLLPWVYDLQDHRLGRCRSTSGTPWTQLTA